VRYMLRLADANYDFSDTLSVCPGNAVTMTKLGTVVRDHRSILFLGPSTRLELPLYRRRAI
jgi:hypothetical protein